MKKLVPTRSWISESLLLFVGGGVTNLMKALKLRKHLSRIKKRSRLAIVRRQTLVQNTGWDLKSDGPEKYHYIRIFPRS